MKGLLGTIGNPHRRPIEFEQLPVLGQVFTYRDASKKPHHTGRLFSIIPHKDDPSATYANSSILQDCAHAYVFTLTEPELKEDR